MSLIVFPLFKFDSREILLHSISLKINVNFEELENLIENSHFKIIPLQDKNQYMLKDLIIISRNKLLNCKLVKIVSTHCRKYQHVIAIDERNILKEFVF